MALDDLLVLLPVLGAPLLHAPVLRWDLLPGLKRPLDGGRDLFGDNKTWLGIAPGRRGGGAGGVLVSIWDQADFVPAVVLLLLPVWAMPLGSVLLAFAVVTAVHLVLNVVGYAIGARTSPI